MNQLFHNRNEIFITISNLNFLLSSCNRKPRALICCPELMTLWTLDNLTATSSRGLISRHVPIGKIKKPAYASRFTELDESFIFGMLAKIIIPVRVPPVSVIIFD